MRILCCWLFFTAVIHGSCCLLLKGYQSSIIASLSFLVRAKVITCAQTDWQHFSVCRNFTVLLNEEYITDELSRQNKLAYSGMTKRTVLTECNLAQLMFHHFSYLSVCRFVTKEYIISLKSK